MKRICKYILGNRRRLENISNGNKTIPELWNPSGCEGLYRMPSDFEFNYWQIGKWISLATTYS